MGSGFESQGAHFKENPADSSESAGFLRSLNKYSFVVRGAYILFAPAGDPSSQSSDTLMSRQRIYAPLRVSVFGVRCGPAGVAVDARGFCVRPVPSELGRGGLSRFDVLRGGWCFAWGRGRGRAVAVWCVAWWLDAWAGAPCFPEAPSGCHTDALRSEARRGRSVRVTGAPA